MKRRSFLQSIAAGIAALFVPAVAAKEKQVVTSIAWVEDGIGGVRIIYPGDICVLENGAYRPAMVSDDVNVFGKNVAIAVPNGNGGFDFAQYPECINVTMDIEIRG